MKILLLLVWSALTFTQITADSFQHDGDYGSLSIWHRDTLSKDFCTINTPSIIIDEEIVQSSRCKRDVGRAGGNDRPPGGRFERSGGGARKSFGNRDEKGAFFKDRDNDHNRFENRQGGGNRRSYQARGNDRRSYRDRDDNRRSSDDRGGDRRPYRSRDDGDQGNRRSYGDRGGDRKPYGDRGGDRRSFGDRGGDRRSFGDRGGDRRPFGDRGGDRRSFGDRGGDRRSFGNRDGDRRSFGDRGGDRRSFGDRDGDRRSFGDRGGDRRSFGDRGGDRRSFGDRGGDRRSFGDRGGDRRFGNRDGDRQPPRDRNDDRRPNTDRDGDRRDNRRSFGNQDNQRRSYDNRDRNDRDKPYRDDRGDRQRPINDRGDDRRSFKGRDDRKQFSRTFPPRRAPKGDYFQQDSRQKGDRTRKYGGPNVTKYRLITITNRTKKGFDLQGTVTMHIDESYFEYSGSDNEKHLSGKDTSEYDTDYSIKGAKLETTAETSSEAEPVEQPAVEGTSKQNASSSKSNSETDTEDYGSEDTYETEYSTDADYKKDEERQPQLEIDSKLMQYSTEDDYPEDESPLKQDSEYSDDVKTTKQRTKKIPAVFRSRTTVLKDHTTKPSASKQISKQTTTSPPISQDHTTQQKCSTVKPSTRNLQHRTPKQTTRQKDIVTSPPAKVPDSLAKDDTDDYDASYEHDYTEEKSDHYKKTTSKRTRAPKKDRRFQSSQSPTFAQINTSIKAQDSSTYENSGDYKDSNEYEHDYTEEESETGHEKSPERTSPLKIDLTTASENPTSAVKSKKDNEPSPDEDSYDDSYTEEGSKDGEKEPPKRTSPPKKVTLSKAATKTTPTKKSKKARESSDSEYDDSYKHDYTEEKAEDYQERDRFQIDPKQRVDSRNKGSASFYDDSFSELSQESKNKLSSQIDYYKHHIYVYNTKSKGYEFVHQSAFQKLNISKDIAFGNTERPEGRKRAIKRQEKPDVGTLDPVFHRQLNMTSITWPVFTTTKSVSRHRFSSRPHPPRKTYYGRPSRARRVHVHSMKERAKH